MQSNTCYKNFSSLGDVVSAIDSNRFYLCLSNVSYDNDRIYKTHMQWQLVDNEVGYFSVADDIVILSIK